MASHINEFLLQHTSTEDACSPEISVLATWEWVVFFPCQKRKVGNFYIYVVQRSRWQLPVREWSVISLPLSFRSSMKLLLTSSKAWKWYGLLVKAIEIQLCKFFLFLFDLCCHCLLLSYLKTLCNNMLRSSLQWLLPVSIPYQMSPPLKI